MQYSQEHLKTMVYAEFGGQTECIMGNWKIENGGAISVTERTCAVPISKLESHISNRCPHYLTESFSRRQEKLV